MRKLLLLILIVLSIFTLTACQNEQEGENTKDFEREEVSITQEITTGANINQTQDGFEGGQKQEVTSTFLSNPKHVAIFSYDALDILNYVGLENTSIEMLGLPKSNIPTYLSVFNSNTYKNVGTLFMPDLDALDLFNPDLIIIGGRTTRSYDLLAEQYPNANILDVSLVYGDYMEGLERNVANLAKIFPSIAEDLNSELDHIKSEISTLSEITEAYDALFILVNGETLSFFGAEGRFAVLYDEFGFMPSDEKDDGGETHGELVGYEYIAAVNPSIIFLMDRGAAIGNESTISSVLDNALIKNTTAGINNDIYELDGIAWYISAGGFESTYTMIEDIENFTSTKS
jgi:iron complex transport system substrate-binding protein